MIIISLLLNCLLLQSCAKDTCIDNEVKTFSYMVNDTEVTITEYRFHNRSSHDYYTWYLDENAKEYDIRRYFFSSTPDGISLSTLLFDNICAPNFKPIVGVNFLKQIRPGDSFSYIFVNAEDDFIKKIKCISDDTMKKYIGEIVNKQFLYGGDFIILN